MYKINDNCYAIEDTDNITFVRDGGGKIDIMAGTEQWSKNPEDGPTIITSHEVVKLSIIPEINI